jgi:predicted membrane protein
MTLAQWIVGCVGTWLPSMALGFTPSQEHVQTILNPYILTLIVVAILISLVISVLIYKSTNAERQLVSYSHIAWSSIVFLIVMIWNTSASNAVGLNIIIGYGIPAIVALFSGILAYTIIRLRGT